MLIGCLGGFYNNGYLLGVIFAIFTVYYFSSPKLLIFFELLYKSPIFPAFYFSLISFKEEFNIPLVDPFSPNIVSCLFPFSP